MDEQEAAARLGLSATTHWANLPRDVQERLFETAVDDNEDARHRLAVFLHERHPRTAHPPKPKVSV